jgi:hypothetical protein
LWGLHFPHPRLRLPRVCAAHGYDERYS